MKNSINIVTVILFSLLTVSTSMVAQKNLKAQLVYNTFWSPGTGPYIETYLSVAGNSVIYKQQPDGKYKAEIEIMVSFKKDGEIKHFDKYILSSPSAESSSDPGFNFLDQQRYPLPNGKYDFELTIADLNASSKKPFTVTQPVELNYHSNITSLSDIQLIESYSKAEPGKENVLTKSGYNLIPYVDNYYPQSKNSIRFYTEVYNTSKVLPGEVCLLTYHIETYEQKRIVEKFRGFSRRETAEVIPLLGEFPIESLPSGNYNLVVEARNKQNEILAFKQSAFIRFSPLADSLQASEFERLNIENTFAAAITNRDTLAEYIYSLRPISSSQEIAFHNNQLKAAKTDILQKFFFDFWQKRNPENPEQAWLAYNEEVKKVNAEFSTKTFKGYNTERGRVYLKYGPPNTRTKEYHEPSAYPYEIWHYYKIANQQNRKFIFYNTDLVTNNFIILYSDVLGEQTGNKNWQAELHRRDTPLKDDSRDYNMRDFTPGNNVFKNFENPR